jgi:hypothetical protein
MTGKLSMLVVVLAMSLASLAEAKTKPFNYTASGSFGPDLHVFADGTNGNAITVSSDKVTVKEWASGAPNGNTCTPPSGVAGSGTEVTFTDSFAIITVLATGDQLFQNLVSGTECIDLTPAAPPFPFNGTLTVQNVGGTGKFAGATGTETLNFAGANLNCGNTDCVGNVQHTETGSVTTP